MTWFKSHATRDAILVGVTVLMAGFPLLARAQSTPPGQSAAPKPPPAAGTPPAQPATSAPPAPAAPKPAAPAATEGTPVLSDSVRALVRNEVQTQLKQTADELKLTQEQRDKARPILLDAAYQIRQLRLKYGVMDRTPANREAMTKEVRALREATDAKLAGVLTPDQMAQYKKTRDEKLAKVRTKMGMADTTAAAKTMADTTAKAKPDTTAPKK
jgi:Spy/CpxP family protein refolding chaperone